MNILLLGSAGFIGTNLAINLNKNFQDHLTLVDSKDSYFQTLRSLQLQNVTYVECDFSEDTDFAHLVEGQDVVYHLVSTNIPTTSNQSVPRELSANIIVTARMLDACVQCGVKKVIFLSSGGTVYGKEVSCPIKEDASTYPISSYGIQKITIEKILYLYQYLYGLDYRVIRLSNPYGPYQRPNGILGAVTTFTYKALRGEEITVFGDGTVIRDFIYIDDAIHAIIQVANGSSSYRTFNIGSGYGTSLLDVLNAIQKVLGHQLSVTYKESRNVDVPVNYLDISRYESEFGKMRSHTLEEGVALTCKYLKKQLDEQK